MRKTSRREFVRLGSTTALATLMAGLPKGWSGAVFADDSPEMRSVRLSISANPECASLVMAHELGYFKKFGLDVMLSKEPTWHALRDKLMSNENQGSQISLGIAMASTLALGTPFTPMVIPWLINRNGQAITLSKRLREAPITEARELKPIADAAKAAGRPLAFGINSPQGTNAMWLRYWLGSGGIHPDRDVQLVSVSTDVMFDNMRKGKLDGFCLGEPFNRRAITEGVGYTALTTGRIWPDHPEKVCAFTEDFAQHNPRTVKAVLKGLHLSSVYLDDMSNRAKAAAIIAGPKYMDCPVSSFIDRWVGKFDFGDGRVELDKTPMIFSSRGCNYPQRAHAMWWMTQLRRWGMLKAAPPYEAVAKRIIRPDIYLEAMHEIGVTPNVHEMKQLALSDGIVLDVSDPERYAKAFPVNSFA